jgi:hypothetical protein
MTRASQSEISLEKKNGDPLPDRRFDNSASRAYLPTMNTQLVVPLPPIFSIANFFAPSTW